MEVPSIIACYDTFSQHPPFHKSYALGRSNKDGPRPFSVISRQIEAMTTGQNVGNYTQTHKNVTLFLPSVWPNTLTSFPESLWSLQLDDTQNRNGHRPKQLV